jgi:hypothetical protein
MQREETARPTAAYVAAALALCSLALAGVFPLDNPDTFGHLAQGRQIAELGHVPSHDTFSFFRPEPQPWRNYEWLSDWLSYAAFASGGANALTALKCALLVLGGGALLGLALGLGGARALSACAVLLVTAIPAARFRFTERPHVVALPLAAIYCLLLCALLGAFGEQRSRLQRAPMLVLLLGVLHVLWVNLHGSHLLGLAMTGLFCATALFDERVTQPQRRALFAALGAQLLASCISPYGPAIAIDAVEHVFNPAYRALVTEWAPWTAEKPFWLIGAPLVQTLGLALVARRLWPLGPAPRALLLTSALLGVAAFRSLRFVAEYLLLSAPVIALAVARLNVRAFDAGIALALSLSIAASAWAAPRLPPAVGVGLGLSLETLPAASGAWLDAKAVAPRVLAAVEDAWFLMYAAPRAKLLVDGRIPFYGAEHIARLRRALDDEAALRALLAQYRVDTVVVRHTDQQHQRFFAHMQRAPGFVRVAIEDGFSLFMRSDAVLRDGAHPRALPELGLYDLDWLIGLSAERKTVIRAALAALPVHANVRGYRGWVEGVLALEPFLRAGATAGVRPARDATEAAQLARVQAQLERAARGAKGVPIVHAYLGLVAAARCELEIARRELDEARFESESRETLLGAQEIALRKGESEALRAFLAQAARMPGAQDDIWLAALRDALATPPRCVP